MSGHFILALATIFLALPALAQNYAHSVNDSYFDNDSTTGTVLHQLVKGVDGTSPLKAILTSPGDTEAIGICSDNCGTTGRSIVALSGSVVCDFDNATTSRDYVVISPTVAGKCHSAGQNRPTSGRIIGRAMITNAAPATSWIVMFGTGVEGTSSGAALPSGLITMILAGSCPTGFTEVSALNGKMLRGTVAANGNVGTTGGNATITPTGTVAVDPITQVITHTHAVNITDPGHTHTLQAQGSTTAATTGTHVMTSTATGGSSRAMVSPEQANSKVTGVTATTSAPAGAVASITPTASFSGTPIDPSPNFTRVIFCSVN